MTASVSIVKLEVGLTVCGLKSMFDIHLRKILWVYLSWTCRSQRNDRADRLAGKATITGGLRLGRSEVFRSGWTHDLVSPVGGADLSSFYFSWQRLVQTLLCSDPSMHASSSNLAQRLLRHGHAWRVHNIDLDLHSRSHRSSS